MDILFMLIGLVVCVTVHEAAHAWVAYKLGDPTPKIDGRVSLNPLRHLDIFGTIMVFIAHFGWGKPVVFNYHNLKHPRRDSALIAMAGPFTNLLTALIIAIFLKYINFPPFIYEVFRTVYSLSIVLFLFNLLPLPPLDGSKLLGLIIPLAKEDWYLRFMSQGPLYLILLILADRLINEVAGFSFFGAYLEFGYDLITTGIFLIT